MGNGAQNDSARKPIDEVSVGSVTIPIYSAPVTIKDGRSAADGTGAPQGEFKTYDSFSTAYYEGSVRVQQRRNTLERARERAKEVAARLNRDGARAEFITERDRRIYALAQLAAKPGELKARQAAYNKKPCLKRKAKKLAAQPPQGSQAGDVAPLPKAA
jgi:hypothetical protein